MKPNPEALGVTPLRRGEVSTTYRIRGPRRALEAFGVLSALEKGDLIAWAMSEKRQGKLKQAVETDTTPLLLEPVTLRNASRSESSYPAGSQDAP